MKRDIIFENLNKQELIEIEGGGLSDLTSLVLETVAKLWMRKAYDPAYQEADFMVYKM